MDQGHPPIDEAAAKRMVLIVRLVIYSVVALLAVGAFALRSSRASSTEQNGADGPQLNGRTSQGLGIWAIVDDGKVRRLRMAWAYTCDNGASLAPFGGTFAPDDSDGKRFWADDEEDLDPAGGWQLHLATHFKGEVKDGDRVVEGEAQAVATWVMNGRVRATCRSGPVSWRVSR
jgi:hypothetical protein